MSRFDLRSLLDSLRRHDVRFVVIGGIAVGAHGYVRATEDLDLVPDPDSENLRRLASALEALEATLPTADARRFDAARDGAVLQRGENITTDTKLGGLDVVQRARGVPAYSSLDRDAVESDVLGATVRICSLARLREMKEAQGRTQDRADLENLPDS